MHKKEKHPFDFVLNMSLYGILLGMLVGFFSGIPLKLILFKDAINPITLSGALLGGVIGSIFGLIYGVFSGFGSGFVMMCVTRIYFREVHHHRNYKIAMGITALATTAFFLIIFPIWVFFEEIGVVIAFMALVFSVHASQRVASQYLRENDVRKPKVK